MPRHLVVRWHVVSNWCYLKVPAFTNRIEVWFGCFKLRVRLTRGLKTEDGPCHFVDLMALGMA